MAQLPVYNQQKNITTQTPAQVRDINTYAQDGISLQNAGNALYELAAKWQASKDAVENLDGKNKLMSGITSILDEASNYNDYNTPEELSQKQQELTKKMNSLVPDIVSGFSNNQKAREFELNGQFATQQNIYKLQEVFRQKYGDMYNANLQQTADSALRNYTKTGDESFKKEYFDAIDTGIQAGYLDRKQAEKLKLDTNEWNYNYVYSQILENPYFKASDEVMSKINPIQQRTLRNFQRTEQKRAQQEARLQAEADFYSNPSPSNYKKVKNLNPKGNYAPIADATPNYNAVSTINGYSDAIFAIKELANTDTSNYNGKQVFLAKAGDVALKIIKSNVSTNGDATLSVKEKDKLIQMLYKSMKDKTFQNQMRSLPNLNNLKATEIAGKGNPVYARQKYDEFQSTRLRKAATEWKKIDDIGKRTCENVIAHFLAGDVKGGLNAYENGLKAAIKQKYWYIPELQNPNLKAGTKFTVNGKVYSFQGFSQKDIIVEAH